MSSFPDLNFVGKSKINRNLIKSEQWEAAKNLSDIEAAQNIVSSLWPEKITERLKTLIKNPQEVLLISQPSTSGTNVIPIVFGNELKKSLEASFAIGDQYFKVGHRKEVKLMSAAERTFERRIYVPHDESELRKLISGKDLFVVDDILTSGASAAEFTRVLESSGAKVVSIVALMGDKRLNMDQSTQNKLETALKKKDIDVSIDALSNIITRSQAGRMIQLINSARTENARKKITERIQGLLNQGSFKSVGRNTKSARYESPRRNDLGDERVFERIKTWPVFEVGRDPEYEILIKSNGNNYKKKIRMTPDIKDHRSFLSQQAKDFACRVARKHHIPDIRKIKISVRPIQVHEKQMAEPKAMGRGREIEL